jgi:hypothetical protein
MKKILLVAMTLFFAIPNMDAKGKEEVKLVLVKEENSNSYYYEGVVPIDGITKEEMFKRAKEWVLSTFKTEDNNAQFDEPNMVMFTSSTLALKVYKAAKTDFVNFKLKVLFKDGKYKFRVDNVMVKTNMFFGYPPAPYNDTKMFVGAGAGYNRKLIEEINSALAGMVVGLENAVKNVDAKKEDW